MDELKLAVRTITGFLIFGIGVILLDYESWENLFGLFGVLAITYLIWRHWLFPKEFTKIERDIN